MADRALRLVPLVFVLLWSTGFIGAKYGLPYAEPFVFLLVRVVITALLLAGMILVMRRRWFWDRRIVYQLFIGALIHGGYLGGVFFAISRGMPAGVSAVIVGMQPLLTALFAVLAGERGMKNKYWIGMFIGFLGVGLVVTDSHDIALHGISIFGLIAIITALVSISLGTVLQKRLGRDTPFLSGALWQYIGSAIVFLLMTYTLENQSIDWQPPFIFTLIWLILILSIGAILLLMVMIQQDAMSRVASYFYLVPPVVLIEGYLLFDERLGIAGIVGTLMAVIAVYLVNTKTA